MNEKAEAVDFTERRRVGGQNFTERIMVLVNNSNGRPKVENNESSVSSVQQNTQMENPATLEWALTALVRTWLRGGCQELQGLDSPFSLTCPQHPLGHGSLLVLCSAHLQMPRQGFLNPSHETQQETQLLTSPCSNGKAGSGISLLS